MSLIFFKLLYNSVDLLHNYDLSSLASVTQFRMYELYNLLAQLYNTARLK
jgi:hypothetical protein